MLTFTGYGEGGRICSITLSPCIVPAREHHFLIHLPDDDCLRGDFDLWAGYKGASGEDYSTSISEPLTKRFIERHRLRKKNPNDKKSEPVKSIILKKS